MACGVWVVSGVFYGGFGWFWVSGGGFGWFLWLQIGLGSDFGHLPGLLCSVWG